jgi:flagellar basal body-associated protein FliL
MWATLIEVLVWVLLIVVLVIALASLVALPLLVVSSWVERRRRGTPDSEVDEDE